MSIAARPLLARTASALLGVLALIGEAHADDSQGEDIPTLQAAEVVAPRLLGGAPAPGSEGSETATRGVLELLRVPNTVAILTREEVRLRRAERSLAGALQGMPSVLVQKTAPLQHSPFIRGWTGYRNLLLIDGIRLNNSAFRSGPNQYWATVDPLSMERLEVVRGPHSVLYGSDAVGGTVNVIPWRRTSFEPGLHTEASAYARLASGERAAFGRLQTEGNQDDLGWAVGVSGKSYGDIESGGGRLPGTGGAHEWDADVRFDRRLGRHWELTAAWQRVRQFDAPRTEQTVDSVSFAGTTVGSELRRDFDQERDLAYVKLGFDGGCDCSPVSRGHVAVSYHRHREERDRLRTGGRQDFQGFTLRQLGVQAQLETPSPWGRFTYGAEYYHDVANSWRRDFTGGVAGTPSIQGPLGDDATYDLLGIYLQDHLAWRRWELIAGARFTYAAADARRVDDPLVPGSDPATPGNVIRVRNDWTNLSASLRGLYHWNRRWTVYGGVSQAFRTPSLSDLTALDSTSGVETPAPGLEPEQFVSFELGLRGEHPRVRTGAAAWYTVIEDSIIASPTGALIMGTPEVRKDNVGDGWVWGLEVETSWRATNAWSLFGMASYMNGEVDQLDAALNVVRRPLDRLKPFSFWAGVRYAPPCSTFWAQADVEHSARADRLALRDETDTRRIPPGGTPAWTTVNVRAGANLGPKVRVSLALENLLDENYRIHGSGQNEPGRSFVLALDMDL